MDGSRNTPATGPTTPVSGQTALKVIFAAAFVIAVVGSTLFSVLGYLWLPAIWASFCMGLYWVVSHHRAPHLVETEDFADSLYYLGFLLTLVSLVIVLVQLTIGDAPTASLAVVLPQFGLALITTILGLVGRTVLLMFRARADDARERAEKRVIRAYDDFAMALDRLTEEADGFGQRVRAQLDMSLDASRGTIESFGGVVENTIDRIRPVLARVQDLASDVVETQERLDAASGSILKNLGRFNEGLVVGSDALREDLAEIGRAVRTGNESIRDSAEEVVGGLSRSAAAMESQIDELAAATRASSEPLREVTESIATMLDASQQVTQRLGIQLAELDRAIERASHSIQAFSGGLGSENERLRAFVNGWQHHLDAISRHRDRLEEQVAGSGDAIMQFRRELAGGARFLSEVVSGSVEPVEHEG